MKKWIVLLVFIHITCLSWSHGDLHERIAAISFRIEKFPYDHDLYLERAHLHVLHANYKAALKDLRRCEKHNKVSDKLYYLKARSYFFSQQYKKCIKELDKMHQKDTKVFQMYAWISMQQKEYAQAAHYYRLLITQSYFPRPENYLDLADAWKLAGRSSLEIEVLEEAIKNLGLVSSITNRMIKCLKDSNQMDHAIALHHRIVDFSTRKEFVLYERALTYWQDGQYQQSQKDLLTAQKELESIPKHRRNSEALIQLDRDIRCLLVQIKMAGL